VFCWFVSGCALSVLVFRCYFIAQSYLSVKKYKEVLALYERVLDYAQQSLEAHKNNQHNSKSKARIHEHFSVTIILQLYCDLDHLLHGRVLIRWCQWKSNRKLPMGYWLALWLQPWMTLNHPRSSSQDFSIKYLEYDIIMVALWNRADHYIFISWFLLLLFFFPRLISAVTAISRLEVITHKRPPNLGFLVVLRLFFIVFLCFWCVTICILIAEVYCIVLWLLLVFDLCFSQYQPRDWLGKASPKWPILFRVRRKTLINDN